MADDDDVGMSGAPESPEELEWMRKHDVKRDAENDAAHDVDTARRSAAHDVETTRMERQIAGLNIAVDSRTAIGIAMGMLMALSDLTPDQAFDLLRRASQCSNRKLSDIAAEMVANHIERVQAT